MTIVGIGASAGGLEAATQILSQLQPAPGLSIVLVQHLSAQHESLLAPLLAAKTPLTVVQVTEGTIIKPRHVYVVPPNVQMSVENGVLHLVPRPRDRSQYTPVDAFFASLARSVQSRAIAVVLSGNASDGAVGVRDVKAAGGITIAQSPETAKFDGMPRAAMATGMVDLVLSPAEIARHLNELPRFLSQETLPSGERISDAQLGEIFTVLRRVSGVDFARYKTPTVYRRLARRMALHRMRDVRDYLRLLAERPEEATGLYQDFLIHVTRFFRDPDSFVVLQTHAFPELIDAARSDAPIRIWVPGCATGEEPYSLCIALLEAMKDRAPVRLQVFATDVSENALEIARAGVYPASIQADVAPELLSRFFTPLDRGGYKIAKSVRDLCVFARHDLTRDPPFSKLDLVMCRNVLIYLDAALQRKLIETFHYALNPGGYLMVGPAETTGHQQIFAMVDKKWRLFRKPGITAAGQLRAGPSPPVRQLTAQPTRQEAPRRNVKTIQYEADRLLLQRFSTTGVVVDEHFNIVHFRGETGIFLQPPPGEPDLNVMKMAREGLLYALRGALREAHRHQRAVRKTDVRLRFDGGWRAVDIEVIPLTAAGASHYLILFEANGDTGAPAADVAGGTSREKPSDRVSTLTRELAASREYMQSIIQELEVTNDELQSANEEILSSNEELQSTNEELDTAKEELQSTNEELNTVNEELHTRNEELTRVNSDLINLLASVDITVAIVSDDLRVRRFTPTAQRVLNLISSDIGRPIGQINPNIVCPDLEQLIAHTIADVTPREREVQDRSGRWYSLRIRPYKNTDQRIDGAVLALIDIDVAKRHVQMLERSLRYVASLVTIMRQPAVLLDGGGRIQQDNRAFRELCDLQHRSLVGASLFDLTGGVWDTQAVRALLENGDGGTRSQSVELVLNGPGSVRAVRLSARSLQIDEEKHWTLLVVEDTASHG